MAKEKKDKKVYRDGLTDIKNPANSVLGKIVVWILVIFTVAAALAGLIISLAALF